MTRRYEVTVEKAKDLYIVAIIETEDIERINEWAMKRYGSGKVVGIKETDSQPKPSQSLVML